MPESGVDPGVTGVLHLIAEMLPFAGFKAYHRLESRARSRSRAALSRRRASLHVLWLPGLHVFQDLTRLQFPACRSRAHVEILVLAGFQERRGTAMLEQIL